MIEDDGIGTELMEPPFKGDGHMHASIPDGRALARCGYPDSQQAVEISNETDFLRYADDLQCPTCRAMVDAGDPGPAEWAG